MGPSDHTRLLHTSLAAGLLSNEAEETDSHLHLRPTQRVPGGTTMPPHRGCHQAQGAAAHLPELTPVPGIWDSTACSQPEVRCSSTHEFAELRLPYNPSVNHCCMKNVSQPNEAQVMAQGTGRQLDIDKYPKKRQESMCYFGRLQHSTLIGFWEVRKTQTEVEADRRDVCIEYMITAQKLLIYWKDTGCSLVFFDWLHNFCEFWNCTLIFGFDKHPSPLCTISLEHY